jgi:hypothetical protein
MPDQYVTLTIDINLSPELRKVMSGLRAASELLDLVPEWNKFEANKAHRKLRRAMRTLKNVMRSDQA